MSKRRFGEVDKRPSGRYRARYTHEGRRHSAPRTFVMREHAEGWLRDEELLISRDDWTPPATRAAREDQSVTVAQHILAVIHARETRPRKPIAKTTRDNYIKSYKFIAAAPLGGIQLRHLTPTDVAQWWTRLDPDKATRNGHAYELLKSVMAEAVEDGLIAQNPCRVRGAGVPKGKRSGPILHSINELRAYLAALHPAHRAQLTIQAVAGLRASETRAIRRCDLDLKEGVVHIRQSAHRVRVGPHELAWSIQPAKTAGSERTVALPQWVLDDLRVMLRDAPVRGREALLFPAGDGKSPIHGSTHTKWHNQAVAAIGRPEVTQHGIRRTALTLAAQLGATPREVMDMAGHTTLAMSMHYQHSTVERDKARARRLHDALMGAGEDEAGQDLG